MMPCCYYGTASKAPRAIRQALGADLTTDIERTYRLEEAGYRVEWSYIPRAITDKNRILVASRPPNFPHNKKKRRHTPEKEERPDE